MPPLPNFSFFLDGYTILYINVIYLTNMIYSIILDFFVVPFCRYNATTKKYFFLHSAFKGLVRTENYLRLEVQKNTTALLELGSRPATVSGALEGASF